VLGRLLIAAGDAPYMLRQGTGRDLYHMIMLKVTDEEAAALGSVAGKPATVIRTGKSLFVPLELEEGSEIGQIAATRYDAANKRWIGTIALSLFK